MNLTVKKQPMPILNLKGEMDETKDFRQSLLEDRKAIDGLKHSLTIAQRTGAANSTVLDGNKHITLAEKIKSQIAATRENMKTAVENRRNWVIGRMLEGGLIRV